MSNQQTTTAPLSTRKLSDNIAFIQHELKPLKGLTGYITTQQFINHVYALASQLPSSTLPSSKQHCINLCSNRYLFTVALCAGILKQHINLLPSNKNIATQKRLSERYADCYVIHNGDCEIAPELTEVNIADCTELATEPTSSFGIPQIDLNTVAAISFTSGSTGDAKPNIKTWRTLLESTLINSHYMIPKLDTTQHLVATVPAQHM